MVFAAAMMLALLVASQGAAQSTPFVPDEWQYGRREDNGTLRYCIDPRDPEWKIAGAIGEAVSAALLVRPEQTVISDSVVTADWTSLYQHLLRECDIYFGFKLIANGYPDWLALSRPYYEASYVLVVADDEWQSLSDIPTSEPIGAALGTTADFTLIGYLATLPEDQRWRRFPMANTEAALAALSRGDVAAALVWGPSAWVLQQSDPSYADLRLIAPAPLPVSTLGVAAALLANESFLRNSLDQAIAALSADGTIEAILTENQFPAQVIP